MIVTLTSTLSLYSTGAVRFLIRGKAPAPDERKIDKRLNSSRGKTAVRMASQESR